MYWDILKTNYFSLCCVNSPKFQKKFIHLPLNYKDLKSKCD